MSILIQISDIADDNTPLVDAPLMSPYNTWPRSKLETSASRNGTPVKPLHHPRVDELGSHSNQKNRSTWMAGKNTIGMVAI